MGGGSGRKRGRGVYIAEEDLEPAEVTTDTIILAGQGAKEGVGKAPRVAVDNGNKKEDKSISAAAPRRRHRRGADSSSTSTSSGGGSASSGDEEASSSLATSTSSSSSSSFSSTTSSSTSSQGRQAPPPVSQPGVERPNGDDASGQGDVAQRKLYIGGMPFTWDAGRVKEYWEFCGPVEEVDLMTFPDTGRFRGIAIVTFQSQAEAEEALKYNGEDCEGKRLVVKRYNKPGQGPAATTPKRCLSV